MDQLSFGTQTHNHQCVAIASAGVFNPLTGSAHNNYRFDIVMDSFTNPTGNGSERTLDFVNNSNGEITQNVTTLRTRPSSAALCLIRQPCAGLSADSAIWA